MTGLKSEIRAAAMKDLNILLRLKSVRLAVAAMTLLALFPVDTRAQLGAPPVRSVDPAEEDPDRRRALKYISETEIALAAKQYVAAAETFDSAWELSVRREDPLLTLNTDAEAVLRPGEHRVQAGARSRLEMIYRRAPAVFRTRYQDYVRSAAEAADKAAAESSRSRDVIDFILRYQFTERAQTALSRLVHLRLSRGEFLQAALQYGRLLRLRDDNTAQSKVMLAVMWRKAGLYEEAVDYLRNVTVRHAGQMVTIDGHDVSVPHQNDDLQAWLTTTLRLKSTSDGSVATQWVQPGGNYRRTMQQSTGPLLPKKKWSVSTFRSLQFPELNTVLEPLAGRFDVEPAVQLNAGYSLISPAVPLLVDDLAIYRCVGSLQAVDAKTGEIRWETLPLDRQMERVLEFLRQGEAGDEDRLSLTKAVLSRELLGHLVRSNGSGQLTSDGKYLFSVEDSSSETMGVELGERNPQYTIPVNYLRAYDITSGSFRGQAGGQTGQGGAVNPMAGMYFLGAPLVMGDRIYVMAENDQGIFLIQLRASHPWGTGRNSEVDLRPVRSQLLTIPRHSLRVHPVRKFSGVIPSYSNGLLICNTCDEQVVAVSAEDHSVRWIYRYPGNVTSPELMRDLAVVANAFSMRDSDDADMEARWLDSLPQISAGRVLLTPRDSDRLVCLDLQTGAELWSHPRGLMRRIVALNETQVVLTGTSLVRCFDAKSGTENWTVKLKDGVICGSSVCDGRLLHVPTNSPAIVTIDLTTGRQLLTRSLNGELPLPGNLVSVGDALYSQNLTSVTRLETPPERSGSALATASRHFFSGEITNAETALRAALNSADTPEGDQQEARELLVTSILESLRENYQGNSGRVKELQQLMDEGVGTDKQLTTLISSMIGMTPGDTLRFSEEWKPLNRLERYRSELRRLVSEGRLNDAEESIAVVASTILDLLQRTSENPERTMKAGGVFVRESRSIAALVRKALQLRSAEHRLELEQLLSEKLLPLIQQSTTSSETAWWLDMCVQCGLINTAVAAVTADETPALNGAAEGVRREVILLAGVDELSQKASGFAMERLFLLWKDQQRSGLMDRLVERSERLSVDEVVAEVPFPVHVAESLARPGRLPDVSPAAATPVPWSGVPKVTPSPAHSAQQSSPSTVMAEAPQRVLPVYGSAGAFSGWSFVQRTASQAIHAYDTDGRYRWAFDPGNLRNSFGLMDQMVPVRAQYVLGYGNVLAVKMFHRLFVLDGLAATPDSSPRLLWQLNMSNDFRRLGPGLRSIAPAWQRVTQYSMEPSGLAPVGPVTRNGIPIYVQRELRMFDLLTGTMQWAVDGLPPNCTMTSTDDELVLVSPSSGELQVRSVVDGSVLRNYPLPEWWVEATENSASSIRDFEVEPGEEQRFRLAVQKNQCFVLRRTFDQSAIESFDLSRGRLSWSIPLPQDSVVSNPVDGHVAVLSDGERLQLFDLITGQKRFDIKVSPAKGSRELHLRSSGGQWLMLTNVFDPEWDYNPVSNSVQINGRVYAVSREDLVLTWEREIHRETLRVCNPMGSPPLPVPSIAPMLLFMKRPAQAPEKPGGFARRLYQAQMIDVRTGQVLYEDSDVGIQLSYHAVRLNHEKDTIEFSFNKRNVLFDYSADAENE